MSRAQAVKRWGVIAAGGEIDDDMRKWLAGVAAKLLAASGEKDSNDFRLAVTRAVGFVGQGDDSLHSAIRQCAAEIPDRDQLRTIVRLLRHDLPQCRISVRAIDLQIARALKNNDDAAGK